MEWYKAQDYLKRFKISLCAVRLSLILYGYNAKPHRYILKTLPTPPMSNVLNI